MAPSTIHTWRRALRGRSRVSHGCADPPLLFPRELEDIFDQELRVILVVALERSRRRARENPVIIFALEQAGRHGRARADRLRVDNPALDPVGFQAASGLQEVGRSRGAVVRWIAGGVALQARRGGAAEEAARQGGFLGCQNWRLFRNVWERLARESLEEAHQLAQLVFRK